MASASGSEEANSLPYRSARHPTATTFLPVSAAASRVSIESFLAASTNPQVFTTTTSASSESPGPVSDHPPAPSRAASSSESTSFRAQPSVTNDTRADDGDTRAGYPCSRIARTRVLTGVAATHPTARTGVAVDTPSNTLSDFAREHALNLTRFAYLVCGDRGRAEDLVQDTFASLYRRFGEHLTIEAPVAYARRSIVNAHISASRLRMPGATVVGAVPDGSVDAVDYGEQDAMWRAIATLPERQRHVLVLRYYVDLTDAEIAETLGCRQGSVRSLATRAFAALREHPGLTGKEQS